MSGSSITVGGSADFGAGPFEPLRNIQGCVLRLDTSGQLVGPSQRILVEEALEIYTAGSAAVSGEAGIKGRIKPGQLADFTVIEQSPIEVEPHTIRRIPVRSTWVGAEKVWGSH